MRISGLNKLSLIDYPGHVACVVFTLGCNMRCDFCHNPEFVLPEKIRALKLARDAEAKFFEFLDTRKGLLDGVSVCGGEPTIHADLPELLMKIKAKGYKVKLDTNGSNPTMLHSLIENHLVDYIAMDIKHTWEKYSTITGITADIGVYADSVQLIRESGVDYEFRTTLIAGVHSREDIASIGEIVRGSRRYYLQRYRPGVILNPDFHGTSPTLEMMHEWRDTLSAGYVDEVLLRV